MTGPALSRFEARPIGLSGHGVYDTRIGRWVRDAAFTGERSGRDAAHALARIRREYENGRTPRVRARRTR